MNPYLGMTEWHSLQQKHYNSSMLTEFYDEVIEIETIKQLNKPCYNKLQNPYK